jgi:hypothetical protein
MSPGVLLIAYLVALYVMAMVFLCQSLRGQQQEPTPATEVGFALQKGQTILGVKDTTETMFFCIGEIEEYVHDEDDTVK